MQTCDHLTSLSRRTWTTALWKVQLRDSHSGGWVGVMGSEVARAWGMHTTRESSQGWTTELDGPQTHTRPAPQGQVCGQGPGVGEHLPAVPPLELLP